MKVKIIFRESVYLLETPLGLMCLMPWVPVLLLRVWLFLLSLYVETLLLLLCRTAFLKLDVQKWFCV